MGVEVRRLPGKFGKRGFHLVLLVLELLLDKVQLIHFNCYTARYGNAGMVRTTYLIY
jgi:hypothetical protein